MPRFYVDPSQIGKDSVILSDGEFNHIKNVLRKQVGDTLLICDGEGHEFFCEIAAFRDAEAVLKILEVRDGNTELSIRIALFQGLPKKDKMELIIEKSVELGAYEVIPVACSRSVAKLEERARRIRKAKERTRRIRKAKERAKKGRIKRYNNKRFYSCKR